MRILFLTDDHKRGTTPANRKDNFATTICNKLHEVLQIVRERDIDYVLHGGDFFDLPTPSLSVCAEFLNIYQQFPVPIFTIAGNHDLFGQNLETLPRTMLGFADRIGIVHLIGRNPVYLEKDGVRIQLTGQGYHYDMDRRERKLDYVVKKRDCDYAIHIVHGMLLDRIGFPGNEYTLVEQILDTEADFTLAGHNHLGFNDVVKEGKYFLNPGALVRLSNHPAEIKRPIQVIILDFNGPEPSYEKVRLKCAAPGDQVLDRTKLEEAAYREQKLAGYLAEVKAAGSYRRTDIRTLIDEIVSSANLDHAVKEEALRRIGMAEEVLASGDEFR